MIIPKIQRICLHIYRKAYKMIHMTKDIFATLNKAQRQAVDTIEGPVMVIAGPGTGKTQLLALRAANILQKTDTAPQNILCLTYTEVGARNMRERLSQLIGKEAYDIRISTYHGFGSELIRQHADYFQLTGNEQAIDAIGQIKLMHTIYETLPATNPLWRSEVYAKDVLHFISEAKRALLTPSDIRAVADANDAYIEQVNKVIRTTLSQFSRMNKAAASDFESFFTALQAVKYNKQLPKAVMPLHGMLLLDFANALEQYHQSGKTNSLTIFKNKWLTKNTNNLWELVGSKENRKLRGAADIYELYMAALTSQHLFDYDDMIHRAIQGLETYDDLRYSLHEQYLYIMLDEFQDTNRAQLRLVELLTNNPVNGGRPNILAVGDDDQAIYSFQGAELSNMLQFVNMYQDVAIINLAENYRSHNDILSTAHGVARTIEERLSTTLGTNQKQLIAMASVEPATIQRHQFKSDIAQYDWVAKRIATLIANNVPAQEIAVIAPKHKFLEPLVPYLMAKNIPVRYEKRENVLEDKHITELLAMAELIAALAHPDNKRADSLWPVVLSADYWRIPTSTIWQISWEHYDTSIRQEAASSWQSRMMQHPTLEPIALFFARLASMQQQETLESMLDYMVGTQALPLHEPAFATYTSPYFEYYFGKAAQEKSPTQFVTTLSNLTVLRQHLRQYRRDQEQPLKLMDLLEFDADYNAAGEKLLNTNPYHSADTAVQLMTAYGAKGLEFGTVFIVAANDDVWGMKSRSVHSNISLPANLQYIRRAGMTKDEKKRLFYVALTRAKHSLFLTSYSHNFAGKTTEPLEFLAESSEKSLTLPPHAQNIIYNDSDAPSIAALQHHWTSRHAQATHTAELKDMVLPRLDSFQLSATHLNAFTDLIYAGPESFFINTVLRFPKAPTADNLFGSAIHETLESLQHRLAKQGELPDTDQAIELFGTKLHAKALSKNDYERLFTRGSQALAQFLPWWWHNFIPTAHAEYSFRHEGSFIGEAHLAGNIDQLVIDPDAKTIRVIDFKTGKPHSRWTKDIKAHKYQQQLIFYKLLVEQSHSFRGYNVDEAALVFVEPDPITDTMHELPIQFNNEDIERTKLLIAAVWHRIMTLDLPDTSDFSKDIKGVLAFEDWLIGTHATKNPAL